PAFQRRPRNLPIRPGRLPARIGEIRHVGNVPDSPAIHAVATNTVPVVKANDHSLFLIGAAKPMPGSTSFYEDIFADPGRIARLRLPPEPPWPRCFQIGGGGKDDENQAEKGTGCGKKQRFKSSVSRFHILPPHKWESRLFENRSHNF